ncbi:hypothetical protein [Marinobacter sp. LQ44]|uniref:hypothetical protein n=1 Tax=unclassified Marinobacter TaxID=83889 RepID=UPI000718F969|nr:hypothetical protein [Marinobacter sp. LQ44]AMQ87748.1 hypothetical protein ASQ50_03105 [Marinobacter sp. LQ44]
MNDLEDIFKKMTTKAKGTWLIGFGVILCTAGYLLTDRWAADLSLLWNIKHSYITIYKDPNSLFGGTRLPFSAIFFVSSVSVVVGAILIFLDSDKK